jgi:uridine phosphorylase
VKAPILSNKHYAEPSVFTAENLLREARRQKSLPRASVPRICVLDPDGDIVRSLVAERRAERDPRWACYHTDLYSFAHDEMSFGIIGCAVGASFAVLVAEELFACGCELLISVTSAGEIVALAEPPYFVLIEKALRDEGTSYHYLPPADFARLGPGLLSTLKTLTIYRGATWTTDAPFRETEPALARCRELGLVAVEMEAAALYAFAEARQKPVVCLAHVTNRMARAEGDFEKGIAGGAEDALRVVAVVGRAFIERG